MPESLPATGAVKVGGAGQPVRPAQPLVWPVFVAFAASAFLGIGGSVVVAVVAALVLLGMGLDQGSMVERLAGDPIIMMSYIVPMQVVLVATAVVALRIMRRSARQPHAIRPLLGLVSARLGGAGWAMVVVGSGVPLAAAVCAASVMPSFSDGESMVEMWRTMSLPVAIAWVLFIGLGPGFGEEIFFRGYVLRRLLRAWRPWAAILVTSLLFALLHVDPPAMALALVLGLWFGLIAWRTGSIWPTIACHATVNSLWNIGQIVWRKNEPSMDLTLIVLGSIGAVSLACFVGACILLMRREPPAADVV